MVQFTAYEELKRLFPATGHPVWVRSRQWLHHHPIDPLSMSSNTATSLHAQDPVVHFSQGAVSKVIATTVTYPYQVVKARLQQRNSPYRGFVDCVVRTARAEGWHGFFRGYAANLIRVVPASAVTLMAYEQLTPLMRLAFGKAER